MTMTVLLCFSHPLNSLKSGLKKHNDFAKIVKTGLHQQDKTWKNSLL